MLSVRRANTQDIAAILAIYNQGIEDRIATLEIDVKDMNYMNEWFNNRAERYGVLVAESDTDVVGWASINPYSHRCAYAGVENCQSTFVVIGVAKALVSSYLDN